MDIYIVSGTNNSIPYGHAMCAEYLGGDMTNFNNWKFFQYDNLDIEPGGWQMPCGTEEENTKLEIREVTGIPNCGQYSHANVVIFEIDENCNVTCVYP